MYITALTEFSVSHNGDFTRVKYFSPKRLLIVQWWDEQLNTGILYVSISTSHFGGILNTLQILITTLQIYFAKLHDRNPFVHNLFLGFDCPHMGLPLPRPIPGPPGASPPDLGFLMVSSTERMRHVASEAAVIALILTTAGSHTKPSKLSHMSSFIMLTPVHSPPVDRQAFVTIILAHTYFRYNNLH